MPWSADWLSLLQRITLWLLIFSILYSSSAGLLSKYTSSSGFLPVFCIWRNSLLILSAAVLQWVSWFELSTLGLSVACSPVSMVSCFPSGYSNLLLSILCSCLVWGLPLFFPWCTTVGFGLWDRSQALQTVLLWSRSLVLYQGGYLSNGLSCSSPPLFISFKKLIFLKIILQKFLKLL